MKKIIKFFALAALMVMFACNPKPVSIINQAKADYAEAVAETPDSLVAFYEVQMILDQPVSVLHEDGTVRLIASRSAIQQDSIVTIIDRTYDKKGNEVDKNVDKVVGYWLGDMNMPFDSLKLDLADAIQRLQEANIILPEADKVTFRTPAAPPFRPVYIFGTHGTFFVAVDAMSGDVFDFSDPEDAVAGIKKDETE